MEPINIRYIPKSKLNKDCSICHQKKGYCNLCDKAECPNRIHVTCAQQNKCLQEVTSKKDKSIAFRAYCMNHKPKDAKRLSIGFVRQMVDKKVQKEMNEKRVQSSNMNANWLLNGPIHEKQQLESIKENANGFEKMGENADKNRKQHTVNNNTTRIQSKKPMAQKNEEPSKLQGLFRIQQLLLRF